MAATVTPMKSGEPFDEAVGIFAGLEDLSLHELSMTNCPFRVALILL